MQESQVSIEQFAVVLAAAFACELLGCMVLGRACTAPDWTGRCGLAAV